MAVLRLVASLILVAAAFGQSSLKLKMNPTGLRFSKLNLKRFLGEQNSNTDLNYVFDIC